MNPMQIIQSYMTKGLTPKGIVMNISRNNPMLKNLIDMAEKGDNESVENFARNLLKERGLDLDTEMSKMKKALGIN